MSTLETTIAGNLQYQPEDVIRFPEGLPGFEACREFLLLRPPNWSPLLLLQSATQASVCLPVVRVCDWDGEALDVASIEKAARQSVPGIHGKELLLLVTVRMGDAGPVVNAAAPLVLDVEQGLGWQFALPEGSLESGAPKCF